ncbi:outer membrane beta-barrel protein [Croceivirga thetidis]|uniref:PorT family protein n=1 Tax=Croceivirga thetidis TaxID=2721623 RepID=A0ABX1GVV5_9FLAO|nr:outer membrane beta-barrel protein [Croceivirga thetidis]NKI33115.1 PorT family protein [Croceivirga thetidis]
MNKFTILLLLFACPLSLKGQNLGFSFGINSSSQKQGRIVGENDFEKFGNKFGYSLGINYTKRLDPNLLFLTGINFTKKGSNRFGEDERANNLREAKIELNFIEVPITFLIASKKKKIGPVLEMGTYLS